MVFTYSGDVNLLQGEVVWFYLCMFLCVYYFNEYEVWCFLACVPDLLLRRLCGR